MKAFLMYAGRDFDMAADLPDSVTALTEDLGLNTLFDAMSGGDEFLLEVARRGVLTSLPDAGAIAYRQHVLADCLENAPVARDMYDVAVEAVLGSKRIYRGIFARSPDATLRWSIEALQLFTGLLRGCGRSLTPVPPAFTPRASAPCSPRWPGNWTRSTSRPSTTT